MAFNLWFLIVGVLLIGMALIGSVLKRMPLSTSLLYMLIGVGLGPLGMGVVKIDPFESAEVLERVTEAAVIVSLFTAGLKMRTPFGDNRWKSPARLASLGMILTVAMVAAAGTTLLALPLGAAILLGAVLAPTDPVLASDVQVEHAADRDRLRFSLTGEAGLNDGTAFPFVMLGLGLLGLHELGQGGWRWFTVDVLWAVVGGLVIGWGLGVGVGRLTVHLRRYHQQAVGLEDFLALGLIALSYGLALLAVAYGFLAVFAAGLALRHTEMRETGRFTDPEEVLRAADPAQTEEELATHHEVAPVYMVRAVLGFCEQLERIAEVGVVLVVGAMLTYADLSLAALLVVALLFFVVRPIAVYGSLLGTERTWRQKPYMAWFGVRGIGSVYYLAYAVAHGLPGPISENHGRHPDRHRRLRAPPRDHGHPPPPPPPDEPLPAWAPAGRSAPA